MAQVERTVMLKALYISGFLLVGLGLLYYFAALQTFNFLVPKDQGSLLAVRDVAYGADARQKVDVYKPSEGTGPWPIVVFVHGGSWQSGSKDPYEFVGRALAARGFVAVLINYRLHPQNKYPAFVEDTALALKWAGANGGQYGGDTSRLFAMGHSAGAYNIAMAVLDKRYAGDVPPLKGVVTLAGPFDFVPLDSSITIEVFGHLADLQDTQPVNHLRADAPAFLILHGRDDSTVKIKNAEALKRGLDSVGAKAELIIYDGISHVDIMLALSKPLRGRAPVLADAVAFMRGKSQ